MISRAHILLFSYLSLFIVNAQLSSNEIWTSVKADFKLNKTLKLSIDESWRFENQNSKETFTELTFGIKLKKNIQSFLSYRFEQSPNLFMANTFENRINFGLRINKKKKPFNIVYKTHIQQGNYTKHRSENPKQENYWRNKLELRYKLNKHASPYFGFEPFCKLTYEDLYINKLRFFSGARIKLKKRKVLKIFLIIDKDIQKSNPKTVFAFGATYKLDIRL